MVCHGTTTRTGHRAADKILIFFFDSYVGEGVWSPLCRHTRKEIGIALFFLLDGLKLKIKQALSGTTHDGGLSTIKEVYCSDSSQYYGLSPS